MPEAKIIFRESNGYTKTTTIDETGYYEMRVAPGWSGTVVPFRIGYSFAPENLIYQQLMNDQPDQNFEASIIQYTISGKIQNSDNNQGLSNITLRYGLAGFVLSTNESGFFTIVVPFEWSGTITPENVGYNFTPQYLTIESVHSDVENQIFSAVSTH